MRELKFLRCNHCGNIIEMIDDKKVVPVCCGEPMQVLKPNSTDAAGEKHVPVIEKKDGTVTVKIGSVAHPMQDEHYIQWIVVVQGDSCVQRRYLKPGEAPDAEFTYMGGAVRAYEYCNLHGLWVAEA